MHSTRVGTAEQLTKIMKTDPSSVCRTAAARALCRLGQATAALPVLTKELKQGSQWERLHAAIVLDEIEDQARPVISPNARGVETTYGSLCQWEICHPRLESRSQSTRRDSTSGTLDRTRLKLIAIDVPLPAEKTVLRYQHCHTRNGNHD